MKTLLVFLISCTFFSTTFADQKHGTYYGAKVVEHPQWFKNSFMELAEDVAEATSENKRVLLYFYQKGCPYCAKLVQYNFSQKNILDKTRKHFDLIAINMWGDAEVISPDEEVFSEKTYSEHLKIQYTPTLIFLDENGKNILRLNGYQPPAKFVMALDYAAGKLEKEFTYPQFLARNSVAKTGTELIPEEYFSPAPFALARNHFPAKKPLAVFFEQRECPACEEFHQKVLTQPEVLERLKQMQVIQLDRWANTPVLDPAGKKTTARKWAESLNLTYAPAIVLFDENGVEVMRKDGYLKHFHTWGVLEYVLSKAYLEQPNFQRFLSDYADQQLEKGIDVNIWK